MAIGLRALRELRRAQSRLPTRHGLDSLRCQSRHAPQCRWSSSESVAEAPKQKPYYITTPIFYVNAAPHIGHLYTMVLADVFKRWQQISGKQAFLCTGTDEHGMKIQRAAAQQEVPPKEFCDENSEKFRALAKMGDISNDFFIRTTDPEHKEAVGQFWRNLKHTLPNKLGLYKGMHKGWYCVSDECFYPNDLVKSMIDPQTGEKFMGAIESENAVEWSEEETWYFPLSKYKDALLRFYDENPNWVQPAHRMSEARAWIENNLEDLSVTRPAARLSWGIPDPEDSNQTIYVWVDALVNYITKAGYGTKWQTARDDMGIWPADLQVIGKDILRFHAVYWPALLLALDLPPPKQIYCHNHWTMSNKKMSKSLGNVVDPLFAIQRWDIDPLRYFLVRNGNTSKDMAYSNDLILTEYEKHLQGNMGNLFYRIAKPKANSSWSTELAVAAYRDGKFDSPASIAEITAGEDVYSSLDKHLLQGPRLFKEEMDSLAPSRAVRASFELLRETNRYISETEPWKLAKDPRAHPELINLVIFNAAEALRITAILLQPVMPGKMTSLLDELGVKPERRTVDFAAKGKDSEYGVKTNYQQGLGRIDPSKTLFPPTSKTLEKKNTPLARAAKRMFKKTTPNKIHQTAEWLALEARVGERTADAIIETGETSSKGEENT